MLSVEGITKPLGSKRNKNLKLWRKSLEGKNSSSGLQRQAEKIINEIITHGNSPLLVLAGPGTGKSTTLAKRAAYLVDNKKIDPEKIYLLSFTNASTEDLKNKSSKLSPKINVGTIHGLANDIAKFTEKYFISSKYDDLLILSDTYPKKGYKELKPILDDQNKSLANLDQSSKNTEYFRLKKFYNSYNFYEITLKAIRALSSSQDIKKHFQKKIKFLLVDEYQDLNKADQKLIACLSDNYRGVTLCGDDDQSIYGFRYAYPEGIKAIHLDKRFKTEMMCYSWRTPKSVINVADSIIRLLHSKRIDKPLHGEESKDRVEIVSIASATKKRDKEAIFICDKINEILKAYPENKPNILILAREGELFKNIKELLNKSKISFEVQKEKLLKSKDARKIYYALRFVINYHDNLAIRWIAEFLDIDQDSILKLVNSSIQQKIDLWETVNRNPKNEAAQELKKTLGKLSGIDLEAEPRIVVAKIGKIFSIKKDSMGFIKFLELSKKAKNLEDLLSQISYEKLDIADYEGKPESPLSQIRIMTIHSSKGLEADIVFVISVEDSILPLNNEKITANDVRLFYVALTRSRGKLYITFVRSRQTKTARGKYGPRRSKFIDMIVKNVSSKYVSETILK